MDVTFGICGLGGRDKTFLHDLKRLDWLRLEALCDLSGARLQHWGQELDVSYSFTEYEDLLASDVDFIFLATPPHLHAQMAIQALKAGKHVLSEVPAVSSIEEGQGLVTAVEETGCQYMLAEDYCYRRDVQAFARFISNGEIGRIIYARGSYCHDCRTYLADWVDQGIRSWFLTYEVPRYITHSLGPLLFVTGERVQRLTAVAPDNRIVVEGDLPVLACVQCQTTSGAIFHSVHSFFVARDEVCYSFTGDTGTIESFPFAVSPLESNPPLLGDTPYRLVRTADPSSALVHGEMVDLDPGEPFNSYRGGSHWESDLCVLAVFAECVRDNKTPPIDVHRALDMTLPGIAAVDSIRQGGQPVMVPAL